MEKQECISKEDLTALKRLFSMLDHEVKYRVFYCLLDSEKPLSRQNIIEKAGFRISDKTFSLIINGFKEFGLIKSERKNGNFQYHSIDRERYEKLMNYKDQILIPVELEEDKQKTSNQ